jgi:hypothetical protein
MEIAMMVQTLGASVLLRLMSQERAAELDSSWLLYGPQDEQLEEAEHELPLELKWAAE